MKTIKDILVKYHQKLDYLDLELIVAHTLKKPRELVLAHPEYKLTKNQELKTKNLIYRRRRGEPIAYILGHKEFYGLNFKVNNNTLIPRPETELLVELAIQELKTKNQQQKTVLDIGTGSGNIIISLAKLLESRIMNQELRFFGIDISSGALKIAKQNATKHGVDKKIKFIKGNLLEPIFKNTNYKTQTTNYILLANLPYLSPTIYQSIMSDVKKYEPKSALLSANRGLAHYEKLLKQTKLITKNHKLQTTNYFEINPEQKLPMRKLIKKHFPTAKIEFFKDLAGKWRACKIKT